MPKREEYEKLLHDAQVGLAAAMRDIPAVTPEAAARVAVWVQHVAYASALLAVQTTIVESKDL